MLHKRPLIYPLYILYILVIGICFNLQVDAQEEVYQIAKEGQEIGALKIKNILPYQYNGSPWIRGLTKDEHGIIYFIGTGDAVKTFDGTHFHEIKIPKFESRSSCILVARDTLWIGGDDGKKEVGFITKNKHGQFDGNSYVSIRAMLPDSLDERQIGSIKQVKGASYFVLNNWGLVRWKSGKIKTWKISEPNFRRLIVYDNQIYIPMSNKLYVLKDEKAEAIQSWREGYLWALLPYDEDNSLAIVTGLGIQELRLFDGKKFTPIFQDLPYNDIKSAVSLDNGYYLFGTFAHGVFILNKKGELITQITKENGLNNNEITNLLVSNDGNILVGTNDGLSMFQFPSPITYYEADSRISSIVRYKNDLFVGGRSGLYQLKKASTSNKIPFLKPVKNANWWINAMLKTNNGILIGTNGGLQFFKDGNITSIGGFLKNKYIQNIYQLENSPELYFVGKGNSVHLLEYNYKNQAFETFGNIIVDNISDLYTIEEDSLGNFFIPEKDFNLLKLNIHEKNKKSDQIKKALLNGNFDVENHENIVAFFKIDKKIIAVSKSSYLKGLQLKYYSDSTNTFLPYTKIKPEFENGEPFEGYLQQAPNGDVYNLSRFKTAPLVYNDSISKKIMTHRIQMRLARQLNGDYQWDNQPFQDIGVDIPALNTALLESDGVGWFCSWSGDLIRFDPNLECKLPDSIRIYISTLKTVETDSTLFQGYTQNKNLRIAIPYKDNSVRFKYAALSFIQSDSIYYRYQLKGYDKSFSNWSHDTQKDYTGLGPGHYTFKVQAVHPWLRTSAITQMAIVILPPWYMTWWAYLGYTLFGIIGIYLIVKLRVKQLEKDKEKLEIIVHERTLQLQEQAIHLKEMDNIKTRFFANISHEFRTPLTLILGPLTKLYQDNFEGNIKNVYDMMIRNAKRLQQLINDLLELSKLESGKLKLKTSKVDFVKFMRMMLANYTSLAETRNIDYKFRSFIEAQEVYIDQSKVEQILHNLLSNAFKFTESGGKVKVLLNITAEDDRPYMEVLVEDSGIGIPKKQLDKIFERFYQADTINYSNQQGTGIGLALAKELVELHYGKLTVKSIEGKGTTFRLLLPLGREHLKEDEIIESNTDVILPSLFENIESGIHEKKPKEIVKTTKPNVLVVEDNPDMRAFIKLILKQDYKLHEAKNGLEGLVLAIKIEPQIIVSDVMMPKMDGISLCQKLKTDWRTSHIPVILLTAKADIDSKLKGLESRADDYLTKPFNEQELRLIIRNRIQQREALRERWSRIVKLEPKELCITSADEIFLNKLTDIIERNIDNGDLGVEKLISDIGVSRTQLHRKLKALTNQSTTEFIRTFRLKRAYDLILKNAGSISEIAYKVGFSSPQYFNRAFRNQFGFAPGHINKSI